MAKKEMAHRISFWLPEGTTDEVEQYYESRQIIVSDRETQLCTNYFSEFSQKNFRFFTADDVTTIDSDAIYRLRDLLGKRSV